MTLVVVGIIGESLLWIGVRALPFEALTERWAYMVVKDLPLPELVLVQAGSFMMGSARNAAEQPVHRVTFARPFYMSKTEVTFEQWDACVADSGCNGYRPADQGWGRKTQPAINLSWRDAQSYVSWLSGKRGSKCRLPSEAEWEYAARAGTMTEYALPAPIGRDDIVGMGLANCRDCGSEWAGRKQTAPIGRFPANAWGLDNMHGNVWEWVEDCEHDSYQGAPSDGRAWLEENVGDCTIRGLRGGSWNREADWARSANRYWDGPDLRGNVIGFRVVCTSLLSSRADQ